MYSLDSAGWTILPTVPTAKNYYISSSGGNDANDGSLAKPFATIQKGITALRPQSGDRLMLKKGDVWNSSIGDWKHHGLPNAPSGIGAYGTGARPKILCDDIAISFFTPSSNIAFIGIDFEANQRNIHNSNFDPNAKDFDGVEFGYAGTNILFEDCRFAYFRDNLVLQAQSTDVNALLENVALRRNVIIGAWGHSDYAGQGIYAQNINGLLIEENVFDYNGWVNNQASIYRHAMYLNHNKLSNVVVRGNIVSRSASFGCQLRLDGVIDGNFFFDNAVHASMSGHTGVFTNNVCVGGHNTVLPTLLPLKSGIACNSVHSTVKRNLFIDKDDPGSRWTVPAIAPGTRSWTPPGARTLVVTNNLVYNWTAEAFGGIDNWDSIQIDNNLFQKCNKSPIKYTGIVRSFETSHNIYSMKDGSRPVLLPVVTDTTSRVLAVPLPDNMWVDDDFIQRINNQSRDTWDSTVTATALCTKFMTAFGGLPVVDPVPPVVNPPVNPAQTSVVSINVFDATTGQSIASPMTNGLIIDLDSHSSICFTATASGPVNHVVFTYDGITSRENIAPYSYPPDNSGRFVGFSPTVGNHQISAIAYDAANNAGKIITITFSVVSKSITSVHLDYANGSIDSVVPKSAIKTITLNYHDGTRKVITVYDGTIKVITV